MHGARRVIMFCLLTAVLPTILLVIPLYLRHSVYADVTYAVAESDVLEIIDGISTVFCQAHSLKMNSSFHAFQLSGMPELSSNRKHIRLKKSMSLPDDTLEYWGFYLLKGSSVALSVCSRYHGSSVMVVKGEKNLKTCGLLDHKKDDVVQTHMAIGQGHVRVTFETVAQEIHSKEETNVPKHAAQYKALRLPEEDFEGEDQTDNLSEEIEAEDNITYLENLAVQYIKKHLKPEQVVSNETDIVNITSDLMSNNETNVHNISSLETRNSRHLRHARRRLKDLETQAFNSKKSHIDNKQSKRKKKKRLEESLNFSNKNKQEEMQERELNGSAHINRDEKGRSDEETLRRLRRNVQLNPTHLLDGGVEHGGNAANRSFVDLEESSVSSFENSLRTCYDGEILLHHSFQSSHTCTNVQALEKHGTMETVHEVDADGYYYYIFYSDNDFIQNDIHAIFDIHKPTYQYAKHSRACYNQTECTFPISFWSDETVIVEVPTRDGIEHEDDDITFLISSCYPRMSVYVIFPVAVLFLILGCAFM